MTTPIGSLAAAILSAAAAGAGFGLIGPAIGLNLDDWGESRSTVGLISTAGALSTLALTIFVPSLMRRIRVRRLIAAGAILAGATFLAFPLLPSVSSWFALRLVFGAALTILFVASEAWILELAPKGGQGRVLGVYVTALAGGLGLGGVLLELIGHRGFAPFAAGAALFLIPILAMRLPGPGATPPRDEGSPLATIRLRLLAAPAIMLAPFAMGAIESGSFALLPLYARDLDLGDDIASRTVLAFALGNILMQPFIGVLADRVGAPLMLAGLAALAFLSPAAVHLAGDSPVALLASLVLFAGSATGLYTIGLVMIAQRFAPGELASANAAFALMYGFGALAAPGAAGLLMDHFGPPGLLIALAAFPGALGCPLALAAISGRRA